MIQMVVAMGKVMKFMVMAMDMAMETMMMMTMIMDIKVQ